MHMPPDPPKVHPAPALSQDKAKIAKQLRAMAEERLFGDKPWPIEDNHAVHRQLLAWGLIKYVNETDSFRTTELGAELDVDEWTDFVGHHELSEIPHRLAECGLLTEEEADHIIFDRWEDGGERLEDMLPPILRRLYRTLKQ